MAFFMSCTLIKCLNILAASSFERASTIFTKGQSKFYPRISYLRTVRTLFLSRQFEEMVVKERLEQL